MNRRSVLAAAGAAAALPAISRAYGKYAPTRRRHIVMVHGAWHGGWCWSCLVPLLAGVGFETSTPTLTGCGERSHLLSRAVTLDTHIRDVVQHIDAEELDGIVLLAHSYGGFVATGVVEAVGSRIDQVVLLDAFAPSDGERMLDYMSESQKASVMAAAERSPTFNLMPMRAAALGITDATDAAWVDRRTTPHPVGTYLQPIKLSHGLSAVGKKAYIACDMGKLAVFDVTKQRIRDDPAWRYMSLAATHDAMVVSPAALASVITDIVSAESGAGK